MTKTQMNLVTQAAIAWARFASDQTPQKWGTAAALTMAAAMSF